MTTLTAQKGSTSSAITFRDMLAFRTCPTRVSRINRNHFDAMKSRLVFDISSQFAERPFRHLVSLFMPKPNPASNARQFLDGDSSTSAFCFFNDTFCDDVIGIRLKSTLSTRERFQFSSDIFWALALLFALRGPALKGATHFVVSPSDFFGLCICMRLAVAVNGDVHDAEVNTKKIGRRDWTSFRYVGGNEKKPFAVFSSDKIALPFSQSEPFFLVLSHDEGNDDPALQSQDRNAINALKTQDAVVIGHRGVFSEDRLNRLVAAIRSSDVSNGDSGHLSRQVKLLAKLIVILLLQCDLVGCLVFKRLFGEPCTRLVKARHRLAQLFGLFFLRQQLHLQRQFHEIDSIEEFALYQEFISAKRRNARIPLQPSHPRR